MRSDVLAKFPNAKRDGAGWAARCPAHDDRRASLSLGEGDDGRALLHCHAGCSLDAILSAANLEKRDLFPEQTTTKASIVATYPYLDEGGAHGYDVVRFAPKDFRQRRADGTWTMKGVRRTLYHLDKLQGKTTVYVVEGEKDADRLWALKLPATTNAGGAGKWKPEYTAQLTAAGIEQIVILPDHDDPGRAHAAQVAISCQVAGLHVKVVTLPDLPVKGDVSDWLDAGHTKDELTALVKGSPVSVSGSPLGVGVLTRNETAESLPWRTAAEIALLAPERPEWIVYGLVGPGIVTEIDGKLKASGKTTFLATMVAAVVTNRPFLNHPTTASPVLWMTEERPQTFLETLRRAHLEARTDVQVLHWHDVKHLPWPAIMAAATDYALSIGARVLIVDTIGQWAGLRGEDENNNGSQLTAAAPLQDAAAKGLAVVVARHERKGGGDVGESGRGGSAFSGAVDIVVSIRRGEGKTKPTVRVLQTLSRFSETPESVVIDMTETGYVVLGDCASVATLEAERALLDRLPDTEDHAADLETLRTMDPVIGKSATKIAIANLMKAGDANRVGSGKRNDAYRYFRAVKTLVSTQTYRVNHQPETEGADDAAVRF